MNKKSIILVAFILAAYVGRTQETIENRGS
jgi:hypothetical protein